MDHSYNSALDKNRQIIDICLITSNKKEFPTHHNLEDTEKVYGSVLCKHIRSIDYEIRN